MAQAQWILLLLVSATLAVGAVAPPPKDVVLIQSALPGTGDMTVHCSGMGADLGVQSVMAGRGYSFSFYLDDAGNAVYSCRFDWAGHWSQFTVFAATAGNVGPCAHCLWTVRADGFYRSEAGQAPTGPVFRWN